MKRIEILSITVLQERKEGQEGRSCYQLIVYCVLDHTVIFLPIVKMVNLGFREI